MLRENFSSAILTIREKERDSKAVAVFLRTTSMAESFSYFFKGRAAELNAAIWIFSTSSIPY